MTGIVHITRDEVAALLRCSERTVLRRVDPKFPPDRTTGRPLYHRARLIA